MNNNPFKKVFPNRSKKGANQKQIIKNDEKNEKEKNDFSHYYSISSNETNTNIKTDNHISKNLFFNVIDSDDEDEELDHPKPLMSDSEEDLEDLKAHFVIKIENKNNLINENKENQDLNLNNKFKGGNSKYEETLYIEDNKNNIKIKVENILNNKLNDINIPLKKNYNIEAVPPKETNQITIQEINNEIDYIISNNNNDILTNKKEKMKREQDGRRIYEYESSNNLKDRSYKVIPRNADNNNIIKNNNYLKRDKNIINKNKYYKNKDVSNNQKKDINSLYIANNRIKYERDLGKDIAKEEYENNNYTQEKILRTVPNLENISKNVNKNINLGNINQISINNKQNLNPNEEIQSFQQDRNKDLDKLNNNDIIQNEFGNGLNISKIKSSEIKYTDSLERNNIFKTKNNDIINRKKSYEIGGNFNDIQTKCVDISKRKKIKEIPKSNIILSPINDNNFKPINPTPPLSNLFSFKIKGKEMKIFQGFKGHRIHFKKINRFGSNNHNYNDILIDKNNVDISFKNYRNSSINENRNRDIYNKSFGRNTYHSINKSQNNQKTLPVYNNDYNNDYYSNYNYDNNQIPDYSFISNNKKKKYIYK